MKTHISTFLLLIFAVVLNGCGTDIDDNIHLADPAKVIRKDSYLFNQLTKVTTENEDPLEEIVCIDFIYPLQLLVYDANLHQIGTQFLTGDIAFSAFLATLPDNQSISISYPISTTLEDGTVFSVNNNSELKLAIDSCSREDIIAYCNSLFCNITQSAIVRCYWKVPYEEGVNNKYAGGVFEANADGTLEFTFNEETFTGSWTFLFINDEFHININLEGTSQVAADWNIDRLVQINGETITIINPPTNYLLKKTCEEIDEYPIGETGPAGGIVCFDKGSYSAGWRYIEAASTDLEYSEWGCLGSLVQMGTNTEIGKGYFNSASVANFHDNLDNYYSNPSVCNILNNGTVASKSAVLFAVNGFDDWFLPSEEELALVYENLHLQGLGGFTPGLYWSSSEASATQAKGIDFNTGSATEIDKKPAINTVRTRAIRYF
jgi:hypothetical protein